MTHKIIAYTGWSDQVGDEMNEWFWTQVVKFIGVGLAISVPTMGLGMMTAPEGVDRWENGMAVTTQVHGAIWGVVGDGASLAAETIDNWMKNESGTNTY